MFVIFAYNILKCSLYNNLNFIAAYGYNTGGYTSGPPPNIPPMAPYPGFQQWPPQNFAPNPAAAPFSQPPPGPPPIPPQCK